MTTWMADGVIDGDHVLKGPVGVPFLVCDESVRTSCKRSGPPHSLDGREGRRLVLGVAPKADARYRSARGRQVPQRRPSALPRLRCLPSAFGPCPVAERSGSGRHCAVTSATGSGLGGSCLKQGFTGCQASQRKPLTAHAFQPNLLKAAGLEEVRHAWGQLLGLSSTLV